MCWRKDRSNGSGSAKTGDPKVEEAYATHFVWLGKGPFHPAAPTAPAVVERAIEIVQSAKLSALVGDVARLDQLAQKKRGAAPLLEEVRRPRSSSARTSWR